MEHIIAELREEPYAHAFLEPVDYIAMNIPTYPKIVENPMDLGTLQDFVESGQVSETTDFLQKLQLIWNNCKLFNAKESAIFRFACNMERVT